MQKGWECLLQQGMQYFNDRHKVFPLMQGFGGKPYSSVGWALIDSK
jgi:hypothetical protein